MIRVAFEGSVHTGQMRSVETTQEMDAEASGNPESSSAPLLWFLPLVVRQQSLSGCP